MVNYQKMIFITKMNKSPLKIFPYFLSFLALLLTWLAVSTIINSELIFPSPASVFIKCKELLFTKQFWNNFFTTLIRCFFSFLISFFLGSILGIAGGKNSFFREFMAFPLAVIRSTPVIAIILISIYLLSSRALPVFISILMNLPIIVTSYFHGFDNVDPSLMNMAKIYNFSSAQKLIYIQLPACKNNIKAAMISVYGLCWKVVVAGEVLCLPKNGLGSVLQKNQIHLETASVFAITILFVFFSWLIEAAVKGVLRRKWKN